MVFAPLPGCRTECPAVQASNYPAKLPTRACPRRAEPISGGPWVPAINRALAGTYPPGSTFKPLVALAALEQGIINEQKTFLSTGGLQLDKWFFPETQDYGACIRWLWDNLESDFYFHLQDDWM